MMDVPKVRALGALAMLGLFALFSSAVAQAAGEGDERRIFVTPHQERPLVHEHPGRHYVAPPLVSGTRTSEPFIKPQYYSAPPPATEKYRSDPGSGATADPSPLGSGGGTGAGQGLLRPIN